MKREPIITPSNLRTFGFIDLHQHPDLPELQNEYPERDEIDECIRWLLKFAEPGPTLALRRTSYGYKHTVERWAGRYISNGAFITAAIELGYRWRRVMNGPNAVFALKMKIDGKRKRGRQPSWETLE